MKTPREIVSMIGNIANRRDLRETQTKQIELIEELMQEKTKDLQTELDDMKALLKTLNARVIPGEMDTGDSFLVMYREWKALLKENGELWAKVAEATPSMKRDLARCISASNERTRYQHWFDQLERMRERSVLKRKA